MIGGPTVFVEDAEGVWREYELPEGKRIEHGDAIVLSDCKVLDGTYRRVRCPQHPKSGEPRTEEYLESMRAWNALMDSDDAQVIFAGGEFVTLVPVKPPEPMGCEHARPVGTPCPHCTRIE